MWSVLFLDMLTLKLRIIIILLTDPPEKVLPMPVQQKRKMPLPNIILLIKTENFENSKTKFFLLYDQCNVVMTTEYLLEKKRGIPLILLSYKIFYRE